jgi:hypothetical protein
MKTMPACRRSGWPPKARAPLGYQPLDAIVDRHPLIVRVAHLSNFIDRGLTSCADRHASPPVCEIQVGGKG